MAGDDSSTNSLSEAEKKAIGHWVATWGSTTAAKKRHKAEAEAWAGAESLLLKSKTEPQRRHQRRKLLVRVATDEDIFMLTCLLVAASGIGFK
jgi:hypothetical protein